jgi:hypothetical protein
MYFVSDTLRQRPNLPHVANRQLLVHNLRLRIVIKLEEITITLACLDILWISNRLFHVF